MRKQYIFIVCIVLSICFTSAQSDDIFYVDSLTLDVTMSGGYRLEAETQSSKIDFVKAEFQFYPVGSVTQEVLEASTTPDAAKEEDTITFMWEKPSFGRHTYSVDSVVKTYNSFPPISEKIKFPLQGLDPSLNSYIKPTEKIDINPEIIKQASELAQGEDDLYKIVFKLATWTKQNINYSLDTVTADASQKASWVLDNRIGVCDELTNLFIAMARSLGIPARFVSGISYTNSELFEENWGLHGWAEVYFPGHGWVSFDPTYGQYGQLDPTHIKLRDSLDSDKSSTRFEWHGYEVSLVPDPLKNNVFITTQGKKVPNIIELQVKFLSSTVGFDSYNIVEARLKNKKNFYAGFEIGLGKPSEVKIMDAKSKYVILKPYEEKSVYWIVHVTKDLSKNYMYTFPAEAYTSIGVSSESVFNSRSSALVYNYGQIIKLFEQLHEQEEKVYSKNIEISCIAPDFSYINENFDITCTTYNRGNVYLRDLEVCIDDKNCQEEDIGIGQSKENLFRTSVTELGEKEVKLSAKNRDVNKFQFIRIFSEDLPALETGEITYPELIEFGPAFNIKFDVLKKSLGSPKNISVKFRFNNKETQWNLEELEASQTFSINLDKTFLNPSENSFDIEVTYHDRKSRRYTLAFNQPVKIKDPGFFGKLMMQLYRINRQLEALLDR